MEISDGDERNVAGTAMRSYNAPAYTHDQTTHETMASGFAWSYLLIMLFFHLVIDLRDENLNRYISTKQRH